VGPRLVAAAALLALAGCAALRPVDPDALALEAVRVDFPAPDTGQLEFSLLLPATVPGVDRVEWELFLDGHRFAAGVEGPRTLEGGRALVRTPLTWKHLGWREGRAWLEVGLRGALDTPGRRFTFRGRQELEVSGRPVLRGAQE
jgi:hypothetical protein